VRREKYFDEKRDSKQIPDKYVKLSILPMEPDISRLNKYPKVNHHITIDQHEKDSPIVDKVNLTLYKSSYGSTGQEEFEFRDKPKRG
jgi:hypothetical protein